MNSIYSGAFWKDAGERAAGTAVAVLLAALGGDALDVVHADWGAVGILVLNAVVFTLLKSVVAANLGSKGTAGFTTATLPVTPVGIGEYQGQSGAGDTASIAVEDEEGGRHALKP